MGIEPKRRALQNLGGRRRPDAPYFVATIPGGFHVPSPGGKIEGGVSFGQYRRITR